MRTEPTALEQGAWINRTLSANNERRLRACEQNLRRIQPVGLFIGSPGDEHAETIWRYSFAAMEEPRSRRLHTIQDMREEVLRGLPDEISCLSGPEWALLMRLCMKDGPEPLTEPEAMLAGEALLRRLWCQLAPRDEAARKASPDGDAPALLMSRTVREAVVKVLDQKPPEAVPFSFLFAEAVQQLLNFFGIIRAEDAIRMSAGLLPKDAPAVEPRYVLRLIRVLYRTTLDHRGRLVILHPGVADVKALLEQMERMDLTAVLSQGHDERGIEELIRPTGESSAFDLLVKALGDSVRPDLSPWLAAQNLRLLVKQGLPYETLREVLAAQLTVRPSTAMLDTLRLMQRQTPTWFFSKRRVLQ